nr:hypothetical protein [Tanacetum cinerariifolium]
GFIEKYVRDPNKTPDSSQRPPYDCPRCGSPVDGLYCRHCALLRKKLKEVWFTICDEHKFFQDFLKNSKSSNDDSNVVNMPQEPIIFNQDPSEKSSQSPPQIDHHCCYGCGNSLDGIFCQQCTCKSCGKGAHYGYNCPSKVLIISNPEPSHDQNVEEFTQTLPSFHPTCYSKDKNSFAYDSTPNLVKDSPNVSTHLLNPRCILMSFVLMMLIIVTVVHLKFRLSMIWNRVTIKTLVSHKDFKVFNNNILVKIPLCCDDDDDEESSIPLRDIIISELPPCIAITPVVSTKDSLIMGDEHLDTIPEKESDEFIKSSVENLVPNPRINEADYDPEEENCLIEKLLYDNSSPRPLEEFIYENYDAAIESFSPSPILVEDSDSLRDEIDLSLTLDDSMPLGIEKDDYDSFHFDIPSSPRPHAEPPDDDEIEPNSTILTVKVVGDISKQYVPMPRHLPTQPTHASNQEKSPHLLSYRGFKAFQIPSKSPMMIYGGNIPILDVPFLHFYPP